MSQSASDSFRNVTRYLGQDYRFAPTYIRPRDPTVTDVKPKEQQGFYPLNSFWSNSTNGNLWVLLSFFNSPVQARWVLLASGTVGPILDIGVPNGTSPITPDVNGLVNFTSANQSVTITGSAGGIGAQNIDFSVQNYTKSTWVPTIDGSTPGTTIYGIQFGSYVELESLVQAEFTVTVASATGTFDLRIGNLPVAINSATNGNVIGSVIMASALTWPVGTTSIALLGSPGTTYLNIWCSGSGISGSAMQMANTTMNIQGTIIYEI